MRRKKFTSFILTLLIFCFQYSYSQQYVVKTYDIENGLPTRNINDACQDSSGVMWFATNYGISKYDGFSFTNFDKSSGLNEQLFRKIQIDEKGIIWALPEFDSLPMMYYKDNLWHELPAAGRNAFGFNTNSFEIIYNSNKPEICVGHQYGYFIYKNEAWQYYKISDDENLNYVYTVVAHKQKFYLSTKKGICIVENGKQDWSLNKLIEPYGDDIIAIHFENNTTSEDKMWVLTEKWLGYIQNNKFTLVTHEFQLPHPSIYYYSFLNTDKKGNVIFGNIWGKYFISKSNVKPAPLMVANGFLSDGATSVFIDREQNIWITDTRGINKINNLKITNYFEKNGLLEDEVTALVEMNDGRIVMAHNKGLSIFSNNTFKTIPFPPTLKNTRRVQDMIKDNKGNIWFISQSLGVGLLKPDGKIEWHNSEKFPTITAIHQDMAGRIWVGADRQLLYLQDGELIEYKKFTPDKNTIRRIFSADDGGILIAGREGLWHIHNDIIEKIPSPLDRMIDNVFSYYKDTKGNKFVGTINGLCIIENDSIVKFRKKGVEIDSPLFFIMQDREENFWLGSNKGIYKWDGGNSLEIYNIYNGLAGWETNRAAGMLDSKGRVWVGTDRGVSCFEPEYDRIPVPVPVISLTGVENSKGTHFDLSESFRISHSENTLIFHFRGISFFNEGLIEYKYMLEGFDQEWQDANQTMIDKVKYTNLKSGKYTFCVKARNFSGNWSKISRSAPFRILQPFYFTWWFILICLFALGVFIYGVVRISLQKTHNIKLEKEIIERKRIEQALIESTQKYHDLVELLPETIYEADCNGKLSYLNGTGFELFGFTHDELQATLLLHQFIAPEESLQIEELLKSINETKLPVKAILTGIKKDGSRFPFSIHSVPLLENGICLGSRGIIIDLTEQKRFEAQLEKNAEDLKILNLNKDKFFSIIAHDLRSPFTSFLGFTEILDDEFNTLSEKDIHLIITSLRKSAANLYQLLDNLLQWSLLQREVTKFFPRKVELLPLVSNCIEIVSNTAKQKEIDIRIDIPASLVIEADVQMLQTIIRNLVSNAVKFTHRGGYVYITTISRSEQFHIISVKDNGIGIDPALAEEIFSLGNNNKTKGTEGELSTGLGLILCREFVEKHRGKIWVESTIGSGSTFFFSLKKP